MCTDGGDYYIITRYYLCIILCESPSKIKKYRGSGVLFIYVVRPWSEFLMSSCMAFCNCRPLELVNGDPSIDVSQRDHPQPEIRVPVNKLISSWGHCGHAMGYVLCLAKELVPSLH